MTKLTILGSSLLGLLAHGALQASSSIVPPAIDVQKLNDQSSSALKERQKLDAAPAARLLPSSTAPSESRANSVTAAPAQSVPMVDLPMPAQQKGPYSTRAENPDLVPLLREAPRPGISAWLGQTIVLRASASPKEISLEKPVIAWVLNGAVICWGEECRIPLDGKLVGPGLSSLVIVAYNASGSTMTRHVLRVLRGYWNPSMPFSDKHVREMNSESVKSAFPVVNRGMLWAQMLEGNAVQAYPENVNVVGAVARNIPWAGQIKVSPRGVLRLGNEHDARWFFLSSSDVHLQGEGGDRVVRLNRGTLRASLPRTGTANQTARIETREAHLQVAAGSDVLVWRIPPSAKSLLKRRQTKLAKLAKEDQYQTRVVVLAGTGKFKLTKEKSDGTGYTEFPTGVELTVYEDGTVAPLARPDGSRMEAAQKRTMSSADLAEMAKKKEAAKSEDFNLDEHMRKVEELAEREEYFEILSELALVADRAAKDVRIPYYHGLALKGLYQPKEAETHLRTAMAQDEDFPDAPWQLGLMYLDDKRWSEADAALDEAASRLPGGDKREAEYEYYAGVANFQTQSDFSARNHFTRALMWHPELEQTLKTSAADFLKRLRGRKRWSVVAPMGVQWDGNPLQLASGEALPKDYSSRSLFRAIAGGMYTWDPASASDDAGRFFGWGANVMYAKHFPSSYSSFDTVIMSANATQTLRDAPPEAGRKESNPEDSAPALAGPKVLKFTETITIPMVKSDVQSIMFSLAAQYESLDASLGFEWDLVGEADAKRHAVTAREVYPWTLWASDAGSRFELEVAADQRVALKSSESHGHNAALTLTPALHFPLTTLTSLKIGLGLGAQKNFYGDDALTLKLAPSVSSNTFLAPWLLASVSAGVETSRISASNVSTKTIAKPNASLMLSGVF